VAASIEALSKALASRIFPRGVLVSDLLGREDVLGPIARAYEAAGFRTHTTLIRMVRIVDESLPDGGEYDDVTFAEPADVAAIRAFLAQLLDRFADQIPEEDELHSAVARQNILIVRRYGELAGLLIFDKTGLTTTLRYWYVGPEFRNEGIGARLIKTLFRIARGGRRIVLWVARENGVSIEKYKHYGFQVEPLIDQIMMRTNKIEEALKQLRPEFDFTTSEDFIGDGMLDSYDVVTLVSDLDRIYGISIAGIDIVPENFRNIAALEQLVRKYTAEP
jgi:ribosomal protein S18 acetylase RimI-like enzyme